MVYLALGTVNLAKMMPAMQAWMMTPTIDWRHMTIIATSHCSVVALKAKQVDFSELDRKSFRIMSLLWVQLGWNKFVCVLRASRELFAFFSCSGDHERREGRNG